MQAHEITGVENGGQNKKFLITEEQLIRGLNNFLTGRSQKTRHSTTVRTYLSLASMFHKHHSIREGGDWGGVGMLALANPHKQADFLASLKSVSARSSAGEVFILLTKYFLWQLPLTADPEEACARTQLASLLPLAEDLK